MADISTYLAAIMSAIYGEDVRGSIHDAIDIINKVSEVVFSTGTAVTNAASSSTGFYDGSLYLNTSTYELWKCVGTDTWTSLGSMKGVGISSIAKTSTSGLVDTYTITYTDGNTSNFAVTNGKDGSVWYKGTALTGTGTSITGFPGNKDDFYLNSSTGIVYVCTATGTAVTATWDYVMTMSGGGGASVLDDLTDVTISSATNGQVLQYDGSKWVNASGSSSSLAGLTDTNITSAADEQFLRYDSGSSKWVNETVTIPDVAVDHNGTASTSAVRKQRIKINSTYYDVDGSVYMEGSANSATFNFSNAAILADSAIDVYTDTWGDNPSNVTSSTGSVTVTFAAAQTRTVRIYIH